jgi:hypothetical protein
MERATNNSLDTDNAFDTVCAIRFALYAQTAPSPAGTALQVKLMLDRRPFGRRKNYS